MAALRTRCMRRHVYAPEWQAHHSSKGDVLAAGERGQKPRAVHRRSSIVKPCWLDDHPARALSSWEHVKAERQRPAKARVDGTEGVCLEAWPFCLTSCGTGKACEVGPADLLAMPGLERGSARADSGWVHLDNEFTMVPGQWQLSCKTAAGPPGLPQVSGGRSPRHRPCRSVASHWNGVSSVGQMGWARKRCKGRCGERKPRKGRRASHGTARRLLFMCVIWVYSKVGDAQFPGPRHAQGHNTALLLGIPPRSWKHYAGRDGSGGGPPRQHPPSHCRDG